MKPHHLIVQSVPSLLHFFSPWLCILLCTALLDQADVHYPLWTSSLLPYNLYSEITNLIAVSWICYGLSCFDPFRHLIPSAQSLIYLLDCSNGPWHWKLPQPTPASQPIWFLLEHLGAPSSRALLHSFVIVFIYMTMWPSYCELLKDVDFFSYLHNFWTISIELLVWINK